MACELPALADSSYITLAKNDLTKTAELAELAVLGSTVSLKLCVLYVQQCY